MAQIAGIKFNNSSSGELKSVTIDLKKHWDAIRPFLENVGALEDDDFEKDWAKGGRTVEEARAESLKRIKAWKKS